MTTAYDPVTKNLKFHFPVGWVDLLSEESRSKRKLEWCLDEPTYNVEYYMELLASDEVSPRRVKLIVTEHDDGLIEFRTTVTFAPIQRIKRGSLFRVSLHAHATLATGAVVVLPLIHGEAPVPTDVRWLSNNTPGFFYVVDGAFNLSVHTLSEQRREVDESAYVSLTHVSFLGRMSNLESVL